MDGIKVYDENVNVVGKIYVVKYSKNMVYVKRWYCGLL